MKGNKNNGSNTTKSVVIDLLHLGNQIATSAIGIQKQVTDTGNPVNIKASSLASKIPTLKPLGELEIFRMAQNKDLNTYYCNTLSIYIDNDGQAAIYTPSLIKLDDFECLSYKSGLNGYSILKHKPSDLTLQASISCNDDHLAEIEDSGAIEGEGIPLPDILRLVPQPEIPLASDVIPIDEELEIVSNGKFTRKFDTPLYTIKTASGEQIRNVIGNTQLTRIFQNHGVGAKFKIVKKLKVQRRNTDESNWKVLIQDLQAPDFSDLQL